MEEQHRCGQVSPTERAMGFLSYSTHTNRSIPIRDPLIGLDEVLEEVHECKIHNATDEAWSDWVILWCMRIARVMSRLGKSIDIINMYGSNASLAELVTDAV